MFKLNIKSIKPVVKENNCAYASYPDYADYTCADRGLNCCDCGMRENGCGCSYCWSCNACDACYND